MTDSKIKDAKSLYMSTGRLNQNVVSKDIAISWYKCKLQNMKTFDVIKKSKHDTNNHFDMRFLSYVDSIVSELFQYALANTNLQICKSRITDENLANMNSVDDLLIGTNGAYNSAKTNTMQMVSKEEHFLDVFSNYHTVGIPITHDEKKLGTLMLVSEHMPNEYDLKGIKDKLLRYYSKEQYSVVSNEAVKVDSESLELKKLFAYPKHYWPHFLKQVEGAINFLLPTLICGSDGSGKTTLAWYLALRYNVPTYINLKDTDLSLHKPLIEQALYHNSTVIVENIEAATKQALLLLTVYTDKKIDSINKQEHSKYKCSKLILSIGNDALDSSSFHTDHKLVEALIEKLRLSTIQLTNLEQFKADADEIVHQIRKRDCFDPYLSEALNYKEVQDKTSFKALISSVLHETAHTQSHELSLEEYEKAYILDVYNKTNQNILLTSSILKISRSTLYRKLDKYQNDTVQDF